MADELVPAGQQEVIVVMQDYEARLNVTWNGQNGDLADPIPFDASDNDIKAMATEAIESGTVAGIAEAQPNFNDFVVDRFAASEAVPYNRVFVRPKTPFGD